MHNVKTRGGFLLLLGFGSLAVLAQNAVVRAPSAALTIQGDIAAPLTVTAKDLAAMPRETVSVTDQDGSQVTYEGVPLRDVLQRAGIELGKELRGKALASYLVAKGRDGYEVVFSLGELGTAFGNEQILLADKRQGKPLFEYQGPFRLVCPGDKAGARSIRMLDTIELVRLQK
jgi:DMSO/TMAO reductase YedYZ molybdopterin-dependent catalytic subunit